MKAITVYDFRIVPNIEDGSLSIHLVLDKNKLPTCISISGEEVAKSNTDFSSINTKVYAKSVKDDMDMVINISKEISQITVSMLDGCLDEYVIISGGDDDIDSFIRLLLMTARRAVSISGMFRKLDEVITNASNATVSEGLSDIDMVVEIAESEDLMAIMSQIKMTRNDKLKRCLAGAIIGAL